MLTIVGKMAPLNGDVHRAAVAFFVATFALRVVCTIQYDRQQLLDIRGGTGGVSVHVASLCLNFDDFPTPQIVERAIMKAPCKETG